MIGHAVTELLSLLSLLRSVELLEERPGARSSVEVGGKDMVSVGRPPEFARIQTDRQGNRASTLGHQRPELVNVADTSSVAIAGEIDDARVADPVEKI
jgi:hypothetical protein